MQDRLPLHEPRGGCSDLRILLQVDFFPGAPVTVGIIHVAAAGEQFDVAFAAELGSSPLGENVRIEDVAFIAALCLGRRVEQKNFAQVAGGCIEAAARSAGKSGDLVGDGFNQLGVVLASGDLKNLALVSGAGQKVSALIESQ